MNNRKLDEFPAIVQNATFEILTHFVNRYKTLYNREFQNLNIQEFLTYTEHMNRNWYNHNDSSTYFSTSTNPDESYNAFREIIDKYIFFSPYDNLNINVIGPYACAMKLNLKEIFRSFDQIFNRTKKYSLPLFLDCVNSLYAGYQKKSITLYRSIIVYAENQKISKRITPDELNICSFNDIFDFNDSLYKIFKISRELEYIFNITVDNLLRIEIKEELSFAELKEIPKNDDPFNGFDFQKLQNKIKKLHSLYRALIISGLRIKMLNSLVHFDLKFLNYSIFPSDFSNIGSFSTETEKSYISFFNEDIVLELYELLLNSEEKLIENLYIPIERFQNFLLSKNLSDRSIELRICIDSLLDINLSGKGYTQYAVYRITYLLPQYSSRKIRNIYCRLSSSVHSNDHDSNKEEINVFHNSVAQIIQELFVEILSKGEFYTHEKWQEIYVKEKKNITIQ